MSTRTLLDINAMGRRASRRREQLHLDQQEVADKAGMSRAYVSRLENGMVANPKVSDLAAVAEALGLSLDALVYGRTSDPDVDLAQLLRQRLGPDLGAAFAAFDMYLANMEQGDIDAAVIVLRSIAARRALRSEQSQ
jgi:transcriptional regulator with XRE-family HTH domain